jgi:hypothetical protein
MLELLRRFLLFLAFWKCRWHKGEPPASYEAEDGHALAYCPNCGRMLWTELCPRCRKDFIAWGAKGFDDICAGALVNESGDVCCRRCYVPERDEDEPGQDLGYEEDLDPEDDSGMDE